MELGGVIVFVTVVLFLLCIIANLKSINRELQKELMEKNIFVIEPLLEMNRDYVIDGDAEALPIADCVVIYHRKNGQLKWTGSGRFYDVKDPIRGHQLHEKLHPDFFDQEVLNRNYLDFLMKHLDLIPINWPSIIPFFGTVYRELKSSRCFVKCLSRRDGIYLVENRYLDTDFKMPVIIK